ncbi:MAG: N-acetylmuramoyl-L-alanine amidase [Oscillospiraceae bacterium]|nr:N-acetylmuramoyl-L-alanine amidase [Oscillospiraceae bacterium]
MTITNKFSTVHTTAKANRDIKYIVIHYTAGTTSKAGSAVNTADFFRTTTTQVSADFTVDDTAVVQYNPNIRNRYTWHCGGNKYNTKGGSLYGICKNSNSIGIEICCNNSIGPKNGKMPDANDKSYSFSDAAVANALWLVKKLMAEYNIPAERVVRHYDVTGKPCPGIIGWNADSGSEAKWTAFKQAISGAAVSASAPKYYVQVGAFGSKSNAEKYLAEVKKIYPDAFIKVM